MIFQCMRQIASKQLSVGNHLCRVVSMLASAALILTLAACQRISERDFAGTWQSSRAVTPIHLAANGEWEIRKDDGTILQYGVWRYEDKQIIWSIKQGGRVVDDPTQVLSVARAEFRLKERDGTTTIFSRID